MGPDDTKISPSSHDHPKCEAASLQDDMISTDATADTEKPNEESNSLWRLVLLTIALASAIFCMSLVSLPA